MDAWVAKLPHSKVHAHGMAIAGVQGSGKSYYVDKLDTGKRWVDADDFLTDLNILKPGGPVDIEEAAAAVVDAVHRGLWVLASTWWEESDYVAVVVPDVGTIVERLGKKTGKETMTGDLSRLRADAVAQSAKLTAAANKANIPVFTDVEAAVKAAEINLTAIYAART